MSIQIFISWSGERSGAIAEILRDWLPTVLPGVETWLSSDDISKGSRWSLELAAQLETAQYGLVVVLPDNQESPWLNFEAGAISKSVEQGRVAPLLFDIAPSDLHGPLAQFQVTRFTKKDLLRLLREMAKLESGDRNGNVAKALDFTWATLKERIEDALKTKPVPNGGKAARTDDGFLFTDEHRKVLVSIGSSKSNSTTEDELAKVLGMKLAKVQMLLADLEKAELVSYVPAIHGNVNYGLTSTGTRYLVDQRVL